MAIDDTGGGAEAGEVTLEPGTDTVYCSVGGHREAGTEFALTVDRRSPELPGYADIRQLAMASA